MSLLTNITDRLYGVAYNFDRLVASAIWGTKEDTISGRVGKGAAKNPVDDVVQDALDGIFPGHTAGAEAHDAALDAVDAAEKQQK